MVITRFEWKLPQNGNKPSRNNRHTSSVPARSPMKATVFALGLALFSLVHPAFAEQKVAATLESLPPGLAQLEGSLSYPGHFVPPLTVCAEEVTTKTRYCTETQVKGSQYHYGVGYQLQVPPGRYQVYATYGNYRAYYSPAVACGLHIRCQDHQPIVVEVQAGQRLPEISPMDWFW